MVPAPAAAHPTYQDMVKAAVLALKDRTGSSVPAISKFISATYKLPANFKKVLSTQLKNLVKSGKLLKVKASYKLGEELKKAPKKPKKKAAPKKKVAKKVRLPARDPVPRRHSNDFESSNGTRDSMPRSRTYVAPLASMSRPRRLRPRRSRRKLRPRRSQRRVRAHFSPRSCVTLACFTFVPTRTATWTNPLTRTSSPLPNPAAKKAAPKKEAAPKKKVAPKKK